MFSKPRWILELRMRLSQWRRSPPSVREATWLRKGESGYNCMWFTKFSHWLSTSFCVVLLRSKTKYLGGNEALDIQIWSYYQEKSVACQPVIGLHISWKEASSVKCCWHELFNGIMIAYDSPISNRGQFSWPGFKKAVRRLWKPDLYVNQAVIAGDCRHGRRGFRGPFLF